ncbi:MAG: biotin-dependent carboxyltransferase family protein [Pseudonocardiales bacterium]|nr:biotin-dependent carboxyltransferase family protein [Actinomycetota bacterium]
MIEIVDPGPYASVQDIGRAGLARLGVARSGAFDRAALRLANRLVGNRSAAAAIEVTLGGLVLRVHDAVTVALAGAVCPGLDWGSPVSLAARATVHLHAPARGLRSYLAVRGGLAVQSELGSRSTDTMSGLGPPRLRRGDRLAIGAEIAAGVDGATASPRAALRQLRVIAGPRDDWFAADALARLCASTWTVRPESNRVGIRLDGPRLERIRTDELPSEPTLPGALQVPPDGRPILFGPDAPVTGGYPVIAVVHDGDLDAAAQWRPGYPIRFSQ